MIPIMIGERDALNLLCARLIYPRLEQFERVSTDLMTLRMSVIIAGKHSRNQSYAMPTLKRATAAAQFSFCWTN